MRNLHLCCLLEVHQVHCAVTALLWLRLLHVPSVGSEHEFSCLHTATIGTGRRPARRSLPLPYCRTTRHGCGQVHPSGCDSPYGGGTCPSYPRRGPFQNPVLSAAGWHCLRVVWRPIRPSYFMLMEVDMVCAIQLVVSRLEKKEEVSD